MPTQAEMPPEETRLSGTEANSLPDLGSSDLGPSNAERILALLREYTEKLKAAQDEFQSR